MIDIDWITIVVNKRLDKIETIELGENEKMRVIGQDYLAYKISEILPEKLRKEGFYREIYINKLLSLQNFKLRREIDFFGRFFLENNYPDIFLKIVNLLIQEGYSFHLTRMDIAATFSAPTEDIIAKFESKRMDFGNLMVTTKKRQKRGLYFKAAHSRFQFIVYSKDQDINRETREEYKEAFFRKFYFNPNEPITRIEQRFIGGKTLHQITEKLVSNPSDVFFKEAISTLLSRGRKKIKIPRSVKKLAFTLVL